jgi:hypothetical protein
MNKFLLPGLVLIILLGGLAYYFIQLVGQKETLPFSDTQPTTQQENQNAQDSNKTIPAPTSTTLYDQAGTPKKVKIQPATIQQSNALQISFVSLPNDIVLEKEAWMDFKQFDSELTDLENQQKNQATEIQSNWSQIIASTDSQGKMLTYIQNSIDSVQTSKQQLTDVRAIVRNPPAGTTPEKKQVLTSLDAVITDLLLLYEMSPKP